MKHYHTIYYAIALLIAAITTMASLQARPAPPVLLPDDTTTSYPQPVLALTAPLDSIVPSRPWSPPLLPTDEQLAEDMAQADRPLTTEEVCAILAGEIHDYASQFLGRRYRLGATGPTAFDCSGFTQNIFRHAGFDLNRTSRAQYTQGESIAKMEDLRPGDLLFFSGRRVSKNVGHVAMVTNVDSDTGEIEFIHASSSKGITYQKFPDNGYFSKRYLGARRILGSDDFPVEPSAAPSSNPVS